MAKQIQIKIVDDLERNYAHRLTFEGLNGHLVFFPEREHHEDFLRRYDYDKTVPPFWSAGICEQRCFTLPFAIFLTCYDICQWHDDVKDGDEFVFEWEGQSFKMAAGTWPTCDAAQDIEKAFRAQHNISEKKARGDV